MGYSIYRPANALPQSLEITVSCDGDHGLLPRPAALFDVGPGEVPREIATFVVGATVITVLR